MTARFPSDMNRVAEILLGLLGLVLLIGFALSGCTTGAKENVPLLPRADCADASNVTYVCVGMEKSARFGACPGCQLDSSRMHALFSNTFGYSGKLLQSAQATRKAVRDAISAGIAQTPTNGLFILYYSGHGGQEVLHGLITSEPEGADVADEYLCLYDSYLLDDEIWNLIVPCRGRVFLCFDACHSQTMYRSVTADYMLNAGLAVTLGDVGTVKSSGFTLKPRALPQADSDFRLLCWSGCKEAEYSFGSRAGGVLTSALLKNWKRGIGYAELWERAVRDVQSVQDGQHPVATAFGGTFTEAYR